MKIMSYYAEHRQRGSIHRTEIFLIEVYSELSIVALMMALEGMA